MSVKSPPRGGPVKAATPYMLDKVARNTDILPNGTVKPTIVIPPAQIAAAPIPAVVRPTMNTGEVGAVAQMIQPPSNTSKDVIKTALILK